MNPGIKVQLGPIGKSGPPKQPPPPGVPPPEDDEDGAAARSGSSSQNPLPMQPMAPPMPWAMGGYPGAPPSAYPPAFAGVGYPAQGPQWSPPGAGSWFMPPGVPSAGAWPSMPPGISDFSKKYFSQIDFRLF